jgi:hypothetical protein
MGIRIYQKQALLSALKNRVSAPRRFHEGPCIRRATERAGGKNVIPGFKGECHL